MITGTSSMAWAKILALNMGQSLVFIIFFKITTFLPLFYAGSKKYVSRKMTKTNKGQALYLFGTNLYNSPIISGIKAKVKTIFHSSQPIGRVLNTGCICGIYKTAKVKKKDKRVLTFA